MALRADGRLVSVEVLPSRTEPDLLGSVWLGGSRPPTAGESRLAKAIEARHTNRQPFLERAVEPLPA